ncbi:WD repeat-containing protein on Y chromosome-like [Liolophura sinensis]|uniref:WD repeat-containing protein on Y chromosome-like n=1 Tax=Liolophura sinensis TaxID=3198878 RepID=UPI00315808A9
MQVSRYQETWKWIAVYEDFSDAVIQFTVDGFDKGGDRIRLEERIKLRHLRQLMHQFMIHKPHIDPAILTDRLQLHRLKERQPAGCMNLKEFKLTISQVMKTNDYEEYVEKLFTKLDTSCDGYVDWNEFCTYMLLLYRENDYLRTKREIPFITEPKIRHIVYNRQESTSRIVTVENPYRYVAVSKEGAVTVWDGHLRFDKVFSIDDEEEDSRSAKRRFKMWVTDMVYMSNCHKLAIASTSRDIRFYDVTSNQYFEEFHLFAMPDVPYCMDYWFDKNNKSGESLLVFGTDTGDIHILYFTKPMSQLFDSPFKRDGGTRKIFYQDLPHHSQWVRQVVCEKVHPEVICKVKYIPDSEAIISSSASPKNSLVIADIQGLKKIYIFKLDKGVENFDYNKSLNLLVTGSSDHYVRLWNPYVTSKPVAILTGHATGVIDVVIHEDLNQVFSYSKAAVLKVWDIKEHTCVQTVVVKFPSSIHGRMPEHGQFPLHLERRPQLSCLLLTCNDYVGQLKLGKRPAPASFMPVTHDTQLCSAVYNPLFKQVVTGCDSSTVAVWELETGNKSIVFSNAHGDEEITCMAFDDSWRRLITGARNGTIKVWNFQNGHNLHKLEPVSEAEVTGIIALLDKKSILAVGWSRLLALYDDSDLDNMYVKARSHWKGGQLHEDDILTLDHCPPHLLATASFDGAIIVWDVDTEKCVVQLRRGRGTKISKVAVTSDSDIGSRPDSTSSRPQSKNSRPNSRHCKSHRIEKGQQAPVDKVLFLRGRLAVRYTESAVLVSSEGGYLRFWSLYTNKHELGYFYVPDSADQSVLAMCTKPNNSILITGDTQGKVKVWDIMAYCIKPQDRRVKTPPPLEASWSAHDSAIVSVEYIEHDHGVFILTASTDKTARLWSLQGEYIGTFGQTMAWNLKVQTTWGHPGTPWTTLDDSKNKGVDVTVNTDSRDEGTQSIPVSGVPLITQVVDKGGDLDIPTLERGETLTSPLPTSARSLITPISTAMLDTKVCQTTINSAPVRTSLHVPADLLKHTYRSQTFAFGTGLQDCRKSFLGVKVDRDLERKKRYRQSRRGQFGAINSYQTSRFGQLCSPYQALTTPNLESVDLPRNLPMSQRMINRGYTSENLTQDDLKVMDLSFFPETPTKDEEPRPSKKSSTPRNYSEEKVYKKLPAIKSATSRQPSHLHNQILALRKQSTFI